MPDDTTGLSRRKILASVGTIGGAAALGGASTMAFFSDEETFANNRLVAGELDLKLAWEEQYFGAAAEAAFEGGAASSAADLLGGGPGTVEAYPGDVATSFDDLSTQDACSQAQFYADAPDDLDPTDPDSHRSQNDDTYDTQTGQVKPLVVIQDAKPGDFGFTRFRLLLCDNPGYIWSTGGIQSFAENGQNEPESKDPDQNTGSGSGTGTQGNDGELVDEIRVRLVQAKEASDLETLLGGISASSGADLVQQFFTTFDMGNAATLKQFGDALSSGTGLPLDGDPFDGGAAGTMVGSNVFMYDIGDGGAQQTQQDCFEADGTADQLAVIWALPVDHANEIQSDSVAVDVGFYTEQCRHNDGSGL